jgi:cytochrome c biogenesis protein CcdA
MKEFLPAITLPTVLLAGFLDGINPCAFTVLLLFITALLATVQTGDTNQKSMRLRIIGMGAIFIGAIFITYLTLGVGLLKSVDIFFEQHLAARIGALLAILFGLWMLKDYFLPDTGLRLQAPGKIGSIARNSARKATFPALLAGGFLIGLCTVPCSGAVYLGVLSLLAAQPTALQGYGYLVLYNVIFVLPLVILLVAASSRPLLNRLAHWNLHHKEGVRLTLGGGVVVLGLLMLVVV